MVTRQSLTPKPLYSQYVLVLRGYNLPYFLHVGDRQVWASTCLSVFSCALCMCTFVYVGYTTVWGDGDWRNICCIILHLTPLR